MGWWAMQLLHFKAVPTYCLPLFASIASSILPASEVTIVHAGSVPSSATRSPVLMTAPQMVPNRQVRTDDDGFTLEPLQPGIIMAEKYIRLKTMISLCSSPPKATIPDLINIIAV